MTIDKIMDEIKRLMEDQYDILEIRHKNDLVRYYIGNVTMECQNKPEQMLTVRFRPKKTARQETKGEGGKHE